MFGRRLRVGLAPHIVSPVALGIYESRFMWDRGSCFSYDFVQETEQNPCVRMVQSVVADILVLFGFEKMCGKSRVPATVVGLFEKTQHMTCLQEAIDVTCVT